MYQKDDRKKESITFWLKAYFSHEKKRIRMISVWKAQYPNKWLLPDRPTPRERAARTVQKMKIGSVLHPSEPLCSERMFWDERWPHQQEEKDDDDDIICASDCGPDGVHNQGEIVFELCEWESRTNRHPRNHIFVLDAQKLILCRPIEVQSFLLREKLLFRNSYIILHVLFFLYTLQARGGRNASSRHPMLAGGAVVVYRLHGSSSLCRHHVCAKNYVRRWRAMTMTLLMMMYPLYTAPNFRSRREVELGYRVHADVESMLGNWICTRIK